MENFDVSAQYIYTAADAVNNTYFVHAITKTNRANYKIGNQPVISYNNDGTIDLELKIIKDYSIPDINVETPVVHTINAGTFEPSAYQQVNINVVLMASDGSSSTIGGAVLSSAAAVLDTRPVEIDGD